MNGSSNLFIQRAEQSIHSILIASICKMLTGLSLILLVGCDVPIPQVSESSESITALGQDFESGASFVLVDQNESAFIVFTGVPKDIDEAKLEEIRSKVAAEEKVNMLTWKQFTQNVGSYAQSMIQKNDYPDFSVVDGVVCLVARTPGAPWALTWNGGIALTYNDYEHARDQYESYQFDPDAYSPIRDPRADPVNPGGHLPAFGCLH